MQYRSRNAGARRTNRHKTSTTIRTMACSSCNRVSLAALFSQHHPNHRNPPVFDPNKLCLPNPVQSIFGKWKLIVDLAQSHPGHRTFGLRATFLYQHRLLEIRDLELMSFIQVGERHGAHALRISVHTTMRWFRTKVEGALRAGGRSGCEVVRTESLSLTVICIAIEASSHAL